MMIVRMYWAKICPGTWELVETHYRKLMSREIEGLRSRLVSRDLQDPDNIFVLTFWRSLQDVETWEASADYLGFMRLLRPLMVGSQSVSMCEVSLGELMDEPRRSISQE